jgi:eukaryotic-like serine/threonine-protein kinase
MDWLKQILTNKLLYISIAGILTFGALAILIVDRWVMPAYTNYNEGVTVPDLTKISLQEAENLLDSYGFRYEILDRRAHSSYPPDYIIDQSPSPRQIVKPNRKIFLTVSTDTRPTVVVPNVENMSLRNARIQLENSGLEVGVISMESGRFRDTVIRQSIAAADTVDQGTVVDLAVSDGLGDELVRVPEIVGLPYQEAQQRILEAGLRIGQITYQPDRETAPYTVLSFTPDREELLEGRELDLIVSELWDAQEVDEAGAVIDDNDDDIDELQDDTDNEQENDDPDN